MNPILRAWLLTGTALVSIGVGGSAFAATVTVNGGDQAIAADPEATPAIVFTTDHKATIDAGIDITGAITAGSDNIGTVKFDGTTTVSGDVGSANAKINLLDLNTSGGGETITFGGQVYAETILFDGSSDAHARFEGDVRADIDYNGAEGELYFADGADFTGDWGSNDGNSGVQLYFEGTHTITGNMAGSYTWLTLRVEGDANDVVTINGNFGDNASSDTSIQVANGATVIVNGNIEGGSNAGLDIDNGHAVLNGDMLTRAADLNGANATAEINGDVYSVYLQNGASIDLNGNVLDILYLDAGTTATLADGMDVGGFIAGYQQASEGTLTFEGSSTVLSLGTWFNQHLSEVTLGGTGKTVTVTQGAISADTLNLNGNTLAVGTTVKVLTGQQLNVDITGAATSGKITSGGAATVHADAVLDLNVDTNEYIADAATFTIINGTGGAGVAGLNAAITDNSLMLDFAQVGAGVEDLVVQATRVATAESLATTTQSKTIAAAFDAMGGAGGDASVGEIQGLLQNAASAAEVDEILNATVRPQDGSAWIGANTVAGQTVTIAMQRLASVRGSDVMVASAGESGRAAGVAYARSEEGSRRVWGQVFGQMATQDQRQGIAGYDSHTSGVVFGIDSKELYDNMTLGIAGSYGRTKVDSDNVNNIQTQTDTYQISLYGDYALDNTTRLDGIFGFSWNETEMDVYDIGGVPGVNAHGEFPGRQFSVQLGVSRDYLTDSGFQLTPALSGQYLYFATDNYQETGAGGASQIVDDSEMQMLELGAELEVSSVYEGRDRMEGRFRPSAVLGVRHDLIGDKMESTSQFVGGGGSFKTYGFEPAQTTYHAGAGVKYYGSNAVDITGKYDLELKEDFQAHNASLRVSYRF